MFWNDPRGPLARSGLKSPRQRTLTRQSGLLRFAGRVSELSERVPAARCALPLPVPEWQGRCFIYGNRNREVVQRR